MLLKLALWGALFAMVSLSSVLAYVYFERDVLAVIGQPAPDPYLDPMTLRQARTTARTCNPDAWFGLGYDEEACEAVKRQFQPKTEHGDFVLPDGLEGIKNPEVAEAIAFCSKAERVDQDMLVSLIRQESAFNPQARSHAGALGLAQLMPATAASLGVTDPYDPEQSACAGARYLKGQLKSCSGDFDCALQKYNAGPAAYARHGGNVPYQETREYARRIKTSYSHS